MSDLFVRLLSTLANSVDGRQLLVLSGSQLSPCPCPLSMGPNWGSESLTWTLQPRNTAAGRGVSAPCCMDTKTNRGLVVKLVVCAVCPGWWETSQVQCKHLLLNAGAHTVDIAIKSRLHRTASFLSLLVKGAVRPSTKKAMGWDLVCHALQGEFPVSVWMGHNKPCFLLLYLLLSGLGFFSKHKLWINFSIKRQFLEIIPFACWYSLCIMYSWKWDLELELGKKSETQSKIINKNDWKSEDVTLHIL